MFIRLLGFGLFFVPAAALGDASLDIYPTTWGSADQSLGWTVIGTPNDTSDAECFNPDGSRIGRLDGKSGSTASWDFLHGPFGITYLSLRQACGGAPNASGTLHFVGVNVESGSGNNGWVSYCDAPSSTYQSCSAYLLHDNRSGYWDIALPLDGYTSSATDATLSVSPGAWFSDSYPFTYWKVGGFPNNADYGSCFQPDGSYKGRIGGLLTIQNLGTFQSSIWGPSNFQDTCHGAHILSTGTVHYVIVNVDSGSGFNAWTNHCDSLGATYATCVSFLQNDHRTGLQDLAIPYVGDTDSILSVSPSTWHSPSDTFTWTISGHPNGGDYGECFNPDGTHLSRFGGGLATSSPGGPIPGNDPLAGPTTFYRDTLQHACDNKIPNSTGTLHFVGVNVGLPGAGFEGWLANCDSPSSTYAGCTSYLLGDNRAGFWDIALPFVGSSTPLCTQNCYSNILFIPGTESSRLYSVNPFDNRERQLWEPGIASLQLDAKQLYLNPNGTSINPVYTKQNAAIDTTAAGDVYKTFLLQLASLKTSGTVNDYAVFPYDWRMSPTSVVNDGTPYNDGTHYLEPLLMSLASSSKSGKVIIVAHSNGGLVTKALMQKLQADGKSNLVDKIVFVDVPQSGTPEAVASLLHGDFQNLGWLGLDFIVSRASARALGANMPDGFSLLPSLAYFASVAAPVVDFSQAPLLRSTSGILGAVVSSAADLRSFMTGGGRVKPSYANTNFPNVLSPVLYDAASAEHASLDSWLPPAGVAVVQIVGWGIDTPSTLVYSQDTKTLCFTLSSCVERTVLEHVSTTTIDGDGTVVLPSEAMSALWPTYYLNLIAYNTETNASVNHGNITESAPFQSLFNALVASSAPATLPPYVSTVVPTPLQTDKRLRIRLHTPYVPEGSMAPAATTLNASIVALTASSASDETFISMTLDAYDNSGNHTGRATNPNPASDLTYVETRIPGSYYQEEGNNPFIGLTKEGVYHLVLTGHAAGTFTLDVVPVLAGVEQAPILFTDIPVTQNTKATLDVSMDQPQGSSLLVDLDGNGTIDLTVPAHINGTEDPLSYLELIRASFSSMHVGKSLSQQLSAKLKSLRTILSASNHSHQVIDASNISHAIQDIENVIEKSYARANISGGDAQTLLQMLAHVEELLVNTTSVRGDKEKNSHTETSDNRREVSMHSD